jgi:acyl carrier protein
MSFFGRFRPPKRPGLRYSEEARLWASLHFPESHQQIAAVIAGILCEQTGAEFSELHALTHFTNDMGVFDFFDATDYPAAVQQEFNLTISEHDLASILRLSDLVEYLYERDTRNAA